MVVSRDVAGSRLKLSEKDGGSDKFYTGHPDREEIKQILFNGGMDRSRPPEFLDDGACWRIVNMAYPRETAFPSTRPGVASYMAGTAAPGRITNVYVYQKSTTVSYVVFSCLDAGGTGQELYYLNTSNLQKVQISSALGSTTPPTFYTFANKLLVAVSGQKLREWAGETSTNPAPAKATGTVTVATQPADAETVTIGAKVYTFKTTRTQPTEVTIGANVNATAANLKAAIDTDSWDITATVATNVVTITYCRTGTIGNSAALTDGTGGNLTLSAAALAGGVTGLALDSVNSYEAPSGGIVLTDKNGRVVVAGDTTYPDRVFFSAPQNAFSWASGVYGDGEYIDVGYQEGNTIAAVVPYLDELMVHKSGQNRELYRLNISDSTVSNWTVSRRFHSGTSAAINQRCAMSAADIHFALEKDFFRVFTSEDSYDEIASALDGNRVYDYLSGATSAASFMASNPFNGYALVFAEAGSNCLVFHYGSRRWSAWDFPHHTVYCACYHESFGKMLIGCSDGFIYKLDDSVATDTVTGGSAFNILSEIIGKAFGTLSMSKPTVKQTIMDYQSIVAGTGRICLVNNSDESQPVCIQEFTFNDAAQYVYDATGYIYDATGYIYVDLYGRIVTFNQAEGESIALRVATTSGAFVLHQIAARVGYQGRGGK